MALLTLQEYKDLTGNVTPTSFDSLIENTFIPQAQSSIEQYLDRLFDPQTYYEWHPFSHQIVLEQFPVNKVKFIGTIRRVAVFSSTEAQAYNFEITSLNQTTEQLVDLTITDANLASTSFSFATFSNMDTLKTAVEAAFPDITLTPDKGFTDLNFQLFRTGTGEEMFGAERADVITRIEDNRTILFSHTFDFWFNTGGIGHNSPIYIVYEGGYETADVPKDLKNITAQIIKEEIGTIEKKISGLMKSEKITNYSYTLADVDSINQTILKYQNQLDKYRRISL